MNFKTADITRYLKQPDIKIKCIVIFGTNEGMIADYTKQFAQTVCPDLNDAFKVAQLSMDALEKDIGLLYGEYNARSLLGGRRVVIIKDGNNNLTTHLKNLFKDNSSDTLLIISSSSLNTKSSLVTLAKDRDDFALISCYDDREENIYTAAREFFVKNGITIANDAMQLLCSRLSNDRKASLNELEKLTTYLGTRRNVEINDIKTVIGDTSSASQEDLCYFIAKGEIAKALEAYQELLNTGEEPVSLVRSLTYHFEKLLNCIANMEKGQSADSTVAALRPPVMFFRKADLVQQLKIWKKQTVLDVLDLLYKCERQCKTTNFPAEEILSYTLMQIGGAARRLSR